METVPIPEWMTRPEFYEKGDRTFFDGEWYFESDKDGNPKGPFRHPLCYAIRYKLTLRLCTELEPQWDY